MRNLTRPRAGSIGLLALAVCLFAGLAVSLPESHIQVRSRVEIYKGSADWRESSFDESFSPSTSAVILCDMWDNHWCQGAAGRVGILARKIAPIIDAAREHGLLIIHAPSETMEYYKDAPQ